MKDLEKGGYKGYKFLLGVNLGVKRQKRTAKNHRTTAALGFHVAEKEGFEL